MVFPPETLDRPAQIGRSPLQVRLMRIAVVLALAFWAFPAAGLGASCLTADTVFEVTRGGDVRLRQPSDLAVYENRLYVLDDLNGRIVAYTLDGAYASSVKLPGRGKTSYLAMDVGGDDNFYLAASATSTIVVINGKGAVVREFKVGTEGGSSEPVGLDVSRGTCFVVDNEEHRIRSYDLDGKPQETWGGLGEGPQLFRYPFRVIQDNRGRIIVSDSLNSRVKIFTPKGEPLLDFGDFGVIEGTLFRPAGLGLWGEDLLMVSDNYLGSVQLFDVQGKYRAVICGGDGKPLLFENPVSIAVRQGVLYVLEMGAGRIRALKIRP